MRPASSALVLAILAVVGLAPLAAGCELIVPQSIGGSIACVDAANACPKGQACIGGTCKACPGGSCTQPPPPDGGPDVVVTDAPSERDQTVRDVTMEVSHKDAAETSSLSPLGGSCVHTTDCQSGLICSTMTLLPGVATPGNNNVCTRACCVSSDCDDETSPGYICYPSLGGDYCIDPTWIGVPAVKGSNPPGASCGGPGDCRSSVCTGSLCQDTCCIDMQCGGLACQYSTLHGTPTLNCGPSAGSGKQGDFCDPGSCSSGACVGPPYPYPDFCLGACCNNGECNNLADTQGAICNWNELNDPDAGLVLLRGCYSAPHPGGTGYQSPCSSTKDCMTGLCYGSKACTQPCCQDSDCDGTMAGWTCSYGSFVQMAQPVDLQVCVPPPL